MPTLKKARSKVAYRIVNRPRDDPEYHEGNETMWVSEEELHPNRYRATTNVNGQLVGLGNEGPSAGLTAEDLAYFAANGYGEANTARQGRRVHFEDPNEEAYDGHGDEEADEEGYYDEEDGEYYYYDQDEEGEDWLDEAEDVTDMRGPMGQAGGKRARAEGGMAQVVREDGIDGGDDDDDAGLFEDEVECEVTDDFLRQLVMGTGRLDDDDDDDDDDDGLFDDDMDGDEDDDAHEDEAAAFDAMMEAEDGEMWRLLTEEERQAIRETHLRGTARRRRRRVADQMAGAALLDDTEAVYPQHDVTRRALERQFDAMLREFDGDEAVNDAYTDDPRTHGPLSMDKYLTALEEFVVDRAGVDLETAEPLKNKGLITQLKLMSHRAGAFDTDQKGGVFVTTLLPDKQNRFVAQYRTETDEIRRQARLRVFKKMLLEKLQAHAAEAIVAAEPDPAKAAEFLKLQAMLKKVEAEENRQYEVPESAMIMDADVEKEVKELVEKELQKREGRVDCETAVSAYSTYFNQPNVIKAPGSKRTDAARRKRVAAAKAKRAAATAAATADSDIDMDGEASRDGPSAAPALRLGERPKDETPEERKARRQAVKAAQRERRQEKSALKQAYKDVENDELKRTAQSRGARRTVKFA